MKQEFELDQYARDSLTLFIGKILKYFNDDNEQQSQLFDELRNTLTEEDLDQLSLTYDFIDDCRTYEIIDSKQMKLDIPILKKALKFCKEHNMQEDYWELHSVIETILNY